MDQFGDLVISCSAGYCGSPVQCIDDDTICVTNGNSLKFVDLNNGTTKYVKAPGDGIQNIAINNTCGVVAFTEEGFNARIFVYTLQSFDNPIITIQSGRGLGYSCLAFANNGSILASCSNIPNIELAVWNWTNGMRLCSVELQRPLLKLSFNPMNWRQFCGNDDNYVEVWNIEQVNDKCFIKNIPIALPFTDGSFGLEFTNMAPTGSRPTTGHGGLQLTKSSIAGIFHHEKEEFDPRNPFNRCTPATHCWAPDNQIFVGCMEQRLIQIDAESYNVTIFTMKEEHDSEPKGHGALPFHLNCLAIHNNGLYVGGKDGVLRNIQIHDKTVSVKFELNFNHEISSLCFLPSYQKLIIGSPKGNISQYELGSSLCEVLSDPWGRIIGIACLNDNQHCVTCSSAGLLSVWSIKDFNCVAKLDLQCEICCLVAPTTSSTVFVGTKYGSVLVVDLKCFDELRCVYDMCLHQSPLTHMSVDLSGTILVTGSSDKHLYILNAHVSSKLDVIGHTTTGGIVVCLKCADVSNDGSQWKVLVGVCSSDHKLGCNQLIEMNFNKSLLSENKVLYMDETRLLKDVSLAKRTYLLKNFIYDISIISKDVAFAITHQGAKIAKFSFANDEDSQSNVMLEATITYSGHAIPDGCMSLSTHGKWLVTGSPDGYIIVRAVGAMNNPVTIQAGNYRLGGVTSVCFTGDSQSILTVAKNGCISSWKWNYSTFGKSKATNAIERYRILMASTKGIRNTEDSHLSKLPTVHACLSHEKMETWYDIALKKAHAKEDEKYAESKTQLRKEMSELRDTILSLIKTNEELPDIEKLDRHEFNMDVEERQSIIAKRGIVLQKVRDEIEIKNTATQYLHHLIKTECWDDMVVKGRALSSGKVKITTFPMRKRSNAEIQELETVVQQLKLGIIESEIRESIFHDGVGANPPLVEKLEHEGEEELTDVLRAVNRDSASTYGSLGYIYGGFHNLMQSQFVLSSRGQKKKQICLLKVGIYKIKTNFNRLFDEVYNFKIQEARRIKERNVRIQKILKDLNMNETVIELTFDDEEQPERFLTVRDDEVTVEKYISEEERLRLEEEARLEGERRRAENADNLRGRALEMMMAGRLETNLEEELKQEIEEPEFFSRPCNEWTEDEQKLAKEHEKKKQQLNEEREKFRKSLEAELKKLQTLNTEAVANFNDRLNQLYQTKLKTELAILQEELKMVRLNASILIEEELQSREIELLRYLEQKKVEKHNSSLSVGNARRDVDVFHDAYETLVADDRTLDKMFRKEFTELDTHTVDVLYRLFKKRPRNQRTLKAAAVQKDDPAGVDGCPFQTRPSSSRAVSAAANTLEKSMQELDAEQHMPENVDADVWKRLITLRRSKVEKEQLLKAKALILADMNAYLQSQIDHDEELKLAIEKTFEDIQRLHEEKHRFHLNLEVQLLLKQGQVEVGACDFIPDYTDSLLLHRSGVENLNATITTLGDSKLASMRESKEFRKGIHRLAWELKEMFMKAEDLQTAAHDLQLLRVTKELQVYLSETKQGQTKQQVVATLEKTIETYNKMHHRNVQDRKRTLRRIRLQIREKTDENNKLDVDLEELALSVAERKNINDANANHHSNIGDSKRMQDIITRRKLVDLAKAQASEIGMLRAEVERLRMRTFPALVQFSSH